MLSALHEALVELFRIRPAFAAELLALVLRDRVPASDHVRLAPTDLGELVPTEYRADGVVLLGGPAEPSDRDPPDLAVVVEVQLRRAQRKRRAWVAYAGGVHGRFGCPVAVLVVCTDDATARWCAEPIRYGPGAVLVPSVIGPGVIPLVTDPAAAGESPELTVLSALAHGAGPAGRPVLDALAGVLADVEDDRLALYSDLVLAVLPAAARSYLEALMTTKLREYQSDFVRKYVHQGRAEGRAEAKVDAVLAVLDARGLAVDHGDRARITATTDLELLDTWVRRAVVVGSAAELFA